MQTNMRGISDTHPAWMPYTNDTLPQQIEQISFSSVRRILEENEINNFKRAKTPAINAGIWERRLQRLVALVERFSRNVRD